MAENPRPDMSGAMWTGALRLKLPDGERQYSQEAVLLGRAPTNDITFHEQTHYMVSGKHARIFRKDGSWWVEDSGSTNGTYLNGNEVTAPAPVFDGDSISLGPSGYDGTAVIQIVDGAGVRPSPANPPSVMPFRAAAQPASRAEPQPSATTQPAQPAGGGGWNPFKGVAKFVERIKEKRELQREVREWEQRIPSLNAAADEACRRLGEAAWNGLATEMGEYKAAEALAQADEAVRGAAAARAKAGGASTALQEAWSVWEAQWRRSTELIEARHVQAQAAATEAQEQAARAKAGVVDLLKDRVEPLREVVGSSSSLLSQLEKEPPDEIESMLASVGARLVEVGEQLTAPVEGLGGALSARRAAIAEAEQAAAVLAEASARVETARADHAERLKQYQEDLGRAERAVADAKAAEEKLLGAYGPRHTELGRELVERPTAGTGALVEFGPAEAAIKALADARAAIDDLKVKIAAAG